MKQTNNEQTLDYCLRQLYLSTIRSCYQEEADLARQESLSYEAYLHELMIRECEERRHKRISRFLRESRLPLEKSLEAFDKSRLPARISGLVNTLLDGSFIERCENILAFGNPGSGKTHLLCAIAQELINRDKRIFFTSCSLLVQELLVAKRDLVLPKALKKLANYDALPIDGYRLCTAESRRNGGAFYPSGILLRKKQRNAHKQFTIFAVGENFQGPNDHSSSH